MRIQSDFPLAEGDQGGGAGSNATKAPRMVIPGFSHYPESNNLIQSSGIALQTIFIALSYQFLYIVTRAELSDTTVADYCTDTLKTT
jgi:hypothetical protein